MRNWIRRKLQSFLYLDGIQMEDVCISVDDRMEWPDPLRFQVQKANGGTIVEVSYYDKKTDRRTHSVHVITNEDDLADSLAKIITYETLKK